jgi:hypothetical protein
VPRAVHSEGVGARRRAFLFHGCAFGALAVWPVGRRVLLDMRRGLEGTDRPRWSAVSTAGVRALLADVNLDDFLDCGNR